MDRQCQEVQPRIRSAEPHGDLAPRLIESMMGLGPRKGNLKLFRLFSLMRGLPSITLK